MTLSLSSRRLRMWLLAITASITLVSLAAALIHPGAGGLARLVSIDAEEFLELCGVALFNAGLAEHLAELLGPEGLRLRFSRD